MRQLFRAARTTFCGAMVASPRRFLQQGGIGAVSDGPPQVFNRHVKRLQRDAAAARGDCEEHAVLRNEVAERLAERLEDTLRRFPVAADVGCGDGALLRCLHGRGGIQTLVQCDSSQNMLARCEAGVVGDISAHTVLADEEALPLASESCDLVMSNLSLHWVNDVPGTLAQIRRALRPDGLFLASMFGGDTLHELKHAFILADMERHGGVHAHVSPFAGVNDAGSLLGRAGFTLPAVDTDTITYYFPDALTLMHSLQGMGENNAIAFGRQRRVSRDSFLAAAAVYDSLYRNEHGVPATFQVLYLAGWAPADGQQQPDARGSAQFSLKEIGEVMEIDPDTIAADAMQEQGIVGSDASVQAPRPVPPHQGKTAPAVDQPRPRTESQAALRKPGSRQVVDRTPPRPRENK